MKVRSVLSAILALVLMGPASIASAAAPASTDPLDFVKQRYEELQSVVKKFPEKDKMQQGIREVMERFVDYPELSRRTLADQWDKLAKGQRSEFVGEFKKMIQRSYVKRFDPGIVFTIDYTGERRAETDGAVTIPSIIRSGRSEAKVEYTVRTVSGKWLAFDVVVDDVSMVRTYRKQFHDIILKDGFKGLLERLRKRNAASQE